VEAWRTAASSGGAAADIEWLVTDQLGTPRMIFDKTGSLANTKRHDYLPFGEELFATQGLRTGTMGYSVNDTVRQKFTQKERDNETGLDYFGSRYYSSSQGRFTSPDPISFWVFEPRKQDEYISNPQRWNKYVYVLNNPLRYIDPMGLAEVPTWGDLSKEIRADLEKRLGKDAEKKWNGWGNDQRQQVLNARAKLIAAGVWDSVKSVDFSRFTIKSENVQVRTPSPRFPNATSTATRQTLSFSIDNSAAGFRIALTTDRDIRPALQASGYQEQFVNHPEGQWQLKEVGDDIVIHFVGLKDPYSQFTQIHFDGGGGGASIKHAMEVMSGGGPTTDDVTRYLGKNESTAVSLRGISSSIDKLLAPK
jgi:RHS repeat-associated protein